MAREWISGFMSRTVSIGRETDLNVLFERIVGGQDEDLRKRSISDLQKLSHDHSHQLAIGENISDLVNCMNEFRDDSEVVRNIVSIMCNITDGNGTDTESPRKNVNLIVEDNSINTFIDLLSHEDSNVKFYTAIFLTNMLKNDLENIQKHIFDNTAGLSALLDLLNTSATMIRNEVVLLLLELSKNNKEYQKVLVFSDTLEILLNIMEEENMGNGGHMVYDSLRVMNNLLKDNDLCQNHFREIGCIDRLPSLLKLEGSDMILLTKDKTNIFMATLELITNLVLGTGPRVYNNQIAISRSHILDSVQKLALGKINSPEIRAKAMWTIGYIIKGNTENIEIFQSAHFDSLAKMKSSQPSLLRLVEIIFGSRIQEERNAALHVFRCYCIDYEQGQIAVATTITPPPEELPPDDEDSVGRILFKHLTSWETCEDVYKPFFATIIFSYVLHGNRASKDVLLKIPVEIPTDANVSSANLLDITMKILIDSILKIDNTYIQIGLLRMLSIWLYDCPNAVNTFMKSARYISFLAKLCSINATDINVSGISALILGICLQVSKSDKVLSGMNTMQLVSCMEKLMRSEVFEIGSIEHKHNYPDPSQIFLYDYEYTLFFELVYHQIKGQGKQQTSHRIDSERSSYEELIELQNEEIQTLKQKLNESKTSLKELQRNQINASDKQKDLQITALQSQVRTYEMKLEDKDDQIKELESSQSEYEILKGDHADLLTLLGELMEKFKRYEERVIELGGVITESEESYEYSDSEESSYE
eukprot:TRINITY_DN12126_c0_g1_i1.p1 TRINITY_DN12126_c0_g1~~TRINITY_DN12126_c0_g1_i1.p1  ORF type:complete len:762 (-),score=124.81 TRINITY_DN12126_c0_g1_i1:46-2331(-)